MRPWVVYTLGLCQMALGLPQSASVSFERVRKAAPDFAEVYRDLAAAYLQSSNIKRALAVLGEGERRWPGDSQFPNAAGVLHTGRGSTDAAIAAFSRAVKIAPDDALGYLNLGLACQLRLEESRRVVGKMRNMEGRWITEARDRRAAARNFQRAIALGGPYAAQAAEALRRLNSSEELVPRR